MALEFRLSPVSVSGSTLSDASTIKRKEPPFGSLIRVEEFTVRCGQACRVTVRAIPHLKLPRAENDHIHDAC